MIYNLGIKRKNKGFTLIELLGIIIILSILFLIVVPISTKIFTSAKKNSLTKSASSVINGIEYELLMDNIDIPDVWTNTNVNINGQKPACVNLAIDKTKRKVLGGEIRFNDGTVIITSNGIIDEDRTMIETNTADSCSITFAKYDNKGLIPSTLQFIDSKEAFNTAYRGFYKMKAIILPAESDAETNAEKISNMVNSARSNIEYMHNDGATLAMSVFYLENYKDVKKLPKFIFDALDEYMDVYREAGYKIVVRFAYGNWDGNIVSPEPDDFNDLLSHVEQLKPFFENNKDVIQAVQLGFIGPWGEMHSSRYNSKQYINQLIDKTLEVVPAPIQIALRKPAFYRDYVNSNDFFDEKLGFTDNDIARIGLFNDSFLATGTDVGTYDVGNRENEIIWQSYLTKYTFFGGELATYIDNNDNYSSMEDSFEELKSLHINYISVDDNNGTFDLWKNSTVTAEMDPDWEGEDYYSYVDKHLGYRFLIENALVPGYKVKQGGNLNFEVTIKNLGFGNMIYKRPVYVILEKDGTYYQALTSSNPQNWLTGTSVTEEYVIKLPGNIKTGKWNLYLYLPDPYETYSDNENSNIAFVNPDCYHNNGFNFIGSFNISAGSDNNNGFYQLNDDTYLTEKTSTIKEIVNVINFDGKISDSFEWTKKYASSSQGQLYLKIVDDDLYVYGDVTGYNASDYNIVRLHFSTNHVPYTHMVDNRNFYTGSSMNNDHVYQHSNVTLAVDIGYEYKIPISSLGITSIDEITACTVQYIGNPNNSEETWNLFANVLYQPPVKGVYIIDGENTSEEWDDILPIVDDGEFKVYMDKSNDYIYMYGEVTSEYSYIGIKIQVEGDNDYKYLAQNGMIYEIVGGSNVYISAYPNTYGGHTFEHKIDKNLIENKTITKMYIFTMDSHWNAIHTYTINFTN